MESVILAVGDSVRCNFTAATSNTTWKLVVRWSRASQQQNIRRNDASKKSLVASWLTAVVASTPSISCEVIYLFTFFGRVSAQIMD